MRILTILGARPQFIKAGCVSREIAKRSGLQEVILHTGQHYDADMSDIFFQEMGIPKPAYNLGIGGQTHGAMTGRMIEAIEGVLLAEKPDVVLVYGDTNSTLAGALAAVKLGVPVAHVEAGLRSHNRKMPEEINRIVTDSVSNWLFAPTDEAVRHLQKEGVEAGKISLVGDVMYDAARYHSNQINQPGLVWLSNLGLVEDGYILATIHRAENTDDRDRINAIFNSLMIISKEIPVVIPLHPRTKAVLNELNKLEEVEDNLQVIGPQGYLKMVQLERHARLIVTDSGGVQKESYFYRVPCVTLRDETEWIETVESGWNYLMTPHCPNAIASVIKSRLDRRGTECELYGDGNSAQKIVDVLIEANT